MKITSILLAIPITLLVTGCTLDEINIENTNEQYQKFYGGAFSEEIASAYMQPDGSHIVVGTQTLGDLVTTGYFLFMTDPFGEIQWSKDIGIENMAVASDMVIENDQIMIAGHMTNDAGDQNIVLWKTNMEGEFVDSLSLGIPDRNEVNPKILRLSNGSSYIIASHIVDGNDIVDNVVYMINSTTYEVEWETMYSVFSENANVVGLHQVADDKILWVGSRIEDDNFDDSAISLNLLNTAGAKINTTQIGLNNNQSEKAYSIRRDNNNYIIAGSTTDADGETSGMLIPFSFNNTTINIGDSITADLGMDIEYELLDVTLTPENRFFVTGYQKETDTDNHDIYIAEWSRTGIEIWGTPYGGSGFDNGKLITHSPENDMLVVYGTANIVTNQAITILQTDGVGVLAQ